MNLLLSHLLDTAAVAERIWEEYLAPSTRELLDRLSGGDGRRFFMWLCGLHDCGKATPAFQVLDQDGARRVRDSGLSWRAAAVKKHRWRHDRAGGRIVMDVLGPAWGRQEVEWLWPLVAGHHGTFPPPRGLNSDAAKGEPQGRGAKWRAVQQALVEVFTRCLGYGDLLAVRPVAAPSKADQLCLAGLVVMADWVASDTSGGRFCGLESLDEVSLVRARERAEAGWRALKLRGGWGQLPVPPEGDLIRRRFGQSARASQAQLVDMAREMPVPGLLFAEAPMGEGKTKAALAAVEMLAARFRADGVFVGMPTQATCDPMFAKVRGWVECFGDGLGEHVSLLHGKRMFNPLWRSLWERQTPEEEQDPYGSVGEDGFDEFGLGAGGDGCDAEGDGPSEWFQGRHRGLLSPFVVGTIDQLLFVAARTKHVMLRFAGLAGKVVVLDEVHAADVHMSQFLEEGLRWLGQAGVPVVLLSATLPAEQRRSLARSYLQGALGQVDVDVTGLPEPEGYPSVSAVFAQEGSPSFRVTSSESWRASHPVRLEWLPDVSADASAVAAAVEREVAAGGVALVVLNTVPRAQEAYRRLASAFPNEVHLLHGRLCAGHRADRTEECLRMLGPEAGEGRPGRTVVVATQLAEQSFDVDADVLVTDVAPIDLLLQRIGRLHRHQYTRRPEHLRTPRVLVTGVGPGELTPELLGASERIYGRYRLLRTAALLAEGAGLHGEGGGAGLEWSIPEQVPELVGAVYDGNPLCPAAWERAEEAARARWEAQESERASKARAQVLTREGEWASRTLAGLHYGGTGYAREAELRALVRDGEPSAEVVIVRRDARGYRALDGTWLGVQGEGSEQVRDAVLGGTTRLPSSLQELTQAVEEELRPLNGWLAVPWLKYAQALVLEESGFCLLGDLRLSYDDALGLRVERAACG